MKIQIEPYGIPRVFYDEEDKKFYVSFFIQEMDEFQNKTVLCVGELEKEIDDE